MPMIYDLTRPLTPGTAVFPGDTRVSITPVMRIDDGASVNVTAITLSAHAGTHVDAPLHYAHDGAGIDHVPLERLIGPCRVVTIDGPGDVTPARLSAALGEAPPPRVLVHTRASAVADDVWDPDFAAIDPQAIAWLAARGVRLIGVDTPSVDPATSKALPAHMACLAADITIIENLRFSGVPDADYELIALPLSIAGNDAAPARVVIRA
jgi:arylformamidase